MHEFSIHIACLELESCCCVKRSYIYGAVWTLFKLSSYVLCRRKKLINVWNNRSMSTTLHYFTAKWMFFTENYFSNQVDSKHFLRTFPTALLRNIKLFFEKNRVVNYFTPTPEIKYLHFQECSCVCKWASWNKPSKYKSQNCMHLFMPLLYSVEHKRWYFDKCLFGPYWLWLYRAGNNNINNIFCVLQNRNAYRF